MYKNKKKLCVLWYCRPTLIFTINPNIYRMDKKHPTAAIFGKTRYKTNPLTLFFFT